MLISTLFISPKHKVICYCIYFRGENRKTSTAYILDTQGCLELSLVEIGAVVLEKKSNLWKVYWQTDDWWS